MKKLGLIGGMSFEGSSAYYRGINQAINARLGGLHSARLVMDSVDFQQIVNLQRSDRWDEAGQLLAGSAQGLRAAGAEAVLICAVTMHLVADAVSDAVDVPLIHIVDVAADALKSAGLRRPLLIATRYTMEHGFYVDRMTGHSIEVITPELEDRKEIHRIIFEELGIGVVKDESRAFLLGVIRAARSKGADSVIFGCTEICLILDRNSLELPAVDSTQAHIDASVAFALDGHSA